MLNIDILQSLTAELGLAKPPPGMTIIRIRGIMTAEPVTLTTSSRLTAAVKVDNFAEQATETSEGPNTNLHDDWFLFEPFQYIQAAGATRDQLAYQMPALCRSVDVRSKRALKEVNQTAWLQVQGNNANTWRFSATLSTLCALP